MKRKNLLTFMVMVCLLASLMACGKKKDNKWQEDFRQASSDIGTFFEEVSKTYAFIEDAEKNFSESEDAEVQEGILDSIEEKMNEEGLSEFSCNLLEKTLNKLSKQFTLNQYGYTLNLVKNDLNNAEVTKETLQNDIQSLQSMLENIELNKEQWDSEEESNEYKNQANDLINQCNAKIAEIDQKAAEEAAEKAKAEQERKKKEEEERKKREQQKKEEVQQSTEPEGQPETQETTQAYVKQPSNNPKFSLGQTVHFKNVKGITGVIKKTSFDGTYHIIISITPKSWHKCGHPDPHDVPDGWYQCVAGGGSTLVYCSSDLDGNGVIEGIEKHYIYDQDEGYFFVMDVTEDQIY